MRISNDGKKYIARYPNYTLEFSTLPQWARTDEKLNQILGQSSSPQYLRSAYDSLCKVATSDYLTNNGFSGTAELVGSIQDVEQAQQLYEMFNLRLLDEEQSSNASTMAQSLCSEMLKYREIVAKLKKILPTQKNGG